jgi:hypothetical protein
MEELAHRNLDEKLARRVPKRELAHGVWEELFQIYPEKKLAKSGGNRGGVSSQDEKIDVSWRVLQEELVHMDSEKKLAYTDSEKS